MNDKPPEHSTVITKITKNRKDSDHPLMSFTAVTTHKSMAEAFVEELVRAARIIIPERSISAEDIVKICQLALQDKPDRSITMVGGRHLRARITDQVSRANRYKEPFSIVILNVANLTDREDYDSIVDTLRERMRQTDLIFLFKYRIALLLPHTEEAACVMLVGRILELLKSCLVDMPEVNAASMTYPHPEIKLAGDVLDWTENQLRA